MHVPPEDVDVVITEIIQMLVNKHKYSEYLRPVVVVGMVIVLVAVVVGKVIVLVTVVIGIVTVLVTVVVTSICSGKECKPDPSFVYLQG